MYPEIMNRDYWTSFVDYGPNLKTIEQNWSKHNFYKDKDSTKLHVSFTYNFFVICKKKIQA